MSTASRKRRRLADRRRGKGFYVVVPAAGDLSRWAAAASLAPALPDDAKRVSDGIARLVRRAVLIDGARPGDSVWIAHRELGEVS